MRKMLLAAACCLGIALVPLCTLPSVCVKGVEAQQSVGTISPIAPKELLLLAARANGLTGDDLQPWHIKIRYELGEWRGVFAAEAKFVVTSQGSIEEIWASTTKYRRTFITNTFNQVEYGTPAGPRRTGNTRSVPPELLRILDQFLRPIPLDSTFAEKAHFEAHAQKLGSSAFECITAMRDPDPPAAAGSNSTFCLGDGSTILRLALINGGTHRQIRNNIVRFQDRYLARDVEEYLGAPAEFARKPIFSAHIEKVELLKGIYDEDFKVPVDAVSPPKVITLDEKSTRGQLLSHPKPVFPPIAEALQISGAVVLALTIQTDGHVSKVGVLSGPAMLQQASIDGVSQWTYKPFQENGQPVEVDTEVTVRFRVRPTGVF